MPSRNLQTHTGKSILNFNFHEFELWPRAQRFVLQLLTVRVDAVECRWGDDRNLTLTKRTLGG